MNGIRFKNPYWLLFTMLRKPKSEGRRRKKVKKNRKSHKCLWQHKTIHSEKDKNQPEEEK